jgi:DNA recombination protein RmuC
MTASTSFLVFLALLVGGGVGAFAARLLSARQAGKHWEERDSLRSHLQQMQLAHARLETELSLLRQRQGPLEASVLRAGEERSSLQRELGQAREALSAASTQLEADRVKTAELLQAGRKAADEKLALLSQARVELANQFKTLAAEIFEERSRRFGEQSSAGIEALLAPLREKLGDFQQKVESLKEDGIAGRSELKTQIEGLRTLNERLSVEAGSLVAALKGSSKTQGDWGEMLLERMLEDCGMRKGHEYLVQESYTREDGTRARPDVILHLPEGKHLVIDAKISLLDYNAYSACNDDAGRAVSLGKHIGSLRQHVRGLTKRDYRTIYQLESIDFVIMFVPIEAAYLLALSRDGRLWQEAWESNVLLVSPGSLYPVLRTVAHLWRQEQQNRNVQEIVERGALLYDKLAAFAGDLVKVGSGLETARDSYEEAMKKLTTGKGNVIRQAELLKGLGVKPSKQLPRELIEVQEELPLDVAEEPGAVVSGESA